MVPYSGDSLWVHLESSSREALWHLKLWHGASVVASTSLRCQVWTCFMASLQAWSCSLVRASSRCFSWSDVIIMVACVCRGQLCVCTLLSHLMVPFIICDVALLQFRAGRSHVWAVGRSGQCGGDTSSMQFFCRIHLLECFQLTTVRNGVPANLGVSLAGVHHAF